VLLWRNGRDEAEAGFEHRQIVFGAALGRILVHGAYIFHFASRCFTAGSSGPCVGQRADGDGPGTSSSDRVFCCHSFGSYGRCLGVWDVDSGQVFDDESAQIVDGERRRNRYVMEGVGRG